MQNLNKIPEALSLLLMPPALHLAKSQPSFELNGTEEEQNDVEKRTLNLASRKSLGTLTRVFSVGSRIQTAGDASEKLEPVRTDFIQRTSNKKEEVNMAAMRGEEVINFKKLAFIWEKFECLLT